MKENPERQPEFRVSGPSPSRVSLQQEPSDHDSATVLGSMLWGARDGAELSFLCSLLRSASPSAFLLVVPAFILFTRWAVSVPVAMLEEGNARESLRRSLDGLRAHRSVRRPRAHGRLLRAGPAGEAGRA